jgi:hypothetical protein
MRNQSSPGATLLGATLRLIRLIDPWAAAFPAALAAVLLTALAAVLSTAPALAQSDDVACSSTEGNCKVTSFSDYGSTTETEITVSPLEGVDFFVTTLDFPHAHDLAVPWERPGDPSAECSQEITCENGEMIECFREGPCSSGQNGFAVYCAMFLPARTPWMPNESIEATLRTCKGLADPWPDLPKPIPSPKPKPKPGPGGKQPGPKKPPPGGNPLPSGACTQKRIVDANTTLRDFHETIHIKTTKPSPGSHIAGNFDSEIAIWHQAPSMTHVVAVVHTDKGTERHETVHDGTTLYWKMPDGGWLKMDPTRIKAGNPMAPPDPATADHDKYGPRGFVQAIAPGSLQYLSTGACDGVLDNDTCFSYYSRHDGFDHNVYVSTSSCLLRSVIGENEEGPLSIVVDYGDQDVALPTGAIRELTGDPSHDAAIMQKLMQK